MELSLSLEEDEILDELNNVYGAEKCVDILRNYISFVQLKKNNKIDFGNYNMLIVNQSEYGFVEQVVEITWKLLKAEKIVNYPYRYLERDDIRKNRATNDFKMSEDIKEEVLIIDSKKIDYSIYHLSNEIKELIKENQNKIFIIVDKDERQGWLNANLGETVTWTMVVEKISKDNKVHYIKKFLKDNKIKYEKNIALIDTLSQQPFWRVKDELLNVVLEAKTKNISFLNDKNIREQLNRNYKKSEENIIGKKGKTGLKELKSMTGMEEVKQQIEQIINYIKVNKKRGKMPTLHMCFLGNPGTGKTTVARIIGKIFSEMNILSDKNVFVEAQRSDLIGKYVGHTAPKTKEVIESADGGVLFIDEAYSIASYVRDEAGMDYGAECIATLIKEMEDKRDSLCVILAGYSKEMEHMLKVNPGFESRIQFKIKFPDYSEEELYEIFKQMAKQENYTISRNIKETLIKYFAEEKQKENFSNARFVRNLFEKVRFEQADRVAKNENENINIIRKCDIENVIEKTKEEKNQKIKIGFAS